MFAIRKVCMADRTSLNKRQRIVMWAMAIGLVAAFIFARVSNADYSSYILTIYIPIVAVGAVLMYLFRDRK
jgi:uncharacterized membrane protein